MRARWPIAIASAMWLGSWGCHRGPDDGLPVAYRRLIVPEARLASPAAVDRGHALFLADCAICHGPRGDGHGLRREGLDPPPRDLTSPDWRASTSPRRVYFVIREGVHGTAMAGWSSLSEADDWDLTAYVLSLAGRPPSEE